MWLTLFLATILRLINLNQSLWLDEAFQFKATHNFSLHDLLTVYLPYDFNPPLSYLINFFFNRLFGWSEIALRIPSVIFAVLTVCLMYRLARLFFDKRQAKIVALFLATAPLHLYYSQEARMYSLAALAVTGSTFFLLKFLKKHQGLWGYILFSVVVIYSHYLAWFIFPAQLFFIYLYYPKKLKALVFPWLMVGLSFIPWLPAFITQLKTGIQASSVSQEWSKVVGGIDFKSLLLVPVKFLIGRISLDNNHLFAALLFLPLAITAFLLVKAFKKTAKDFNLIWFWLVIPALLITLISFKLPLLAYFRLLFLLPAFYLIIAKGIFALPKSAQTALTVFWLIFNLSMSGIYLFNSRFHRENWQDLSATLFKMNDQKVPVFVIPVVDAPLKYYYPDTGLILATDDLNDFHLPDSFWYVPYAEPIFDPQLHFKDNLTRQGFKAVFVQHFRGDLTLIKYSY